MENISKKMDISLNLMPSFYSKHLGIKYGENYYFDPEYRTKIEKEEFLLLRDMLGQFNINRDVFCPSANLFIQPVDLIMKTQGADWRFPEDATLESMGTPWANLTKNEIADIDANDAANHRIINDILEQYRNMTKLFGDKADILCSKSGVMSIHTPFTTAHQLCGESLFILMMTDVDAVKVIFEKVWQIYQAVFAKIQNETGANFTRINLGDCSASMLSPDLYKKLVVPFNKKIARNFKSVGYHSCGPSTHIIDGFSGLGSLDSIELGPGTDLVKVTNMMPKTCIRPLFDPGIMRDGSVGKVEDQAIKIIHDTNKAAQRLLCAWSFDRETPMENIKRLYETVNKYTAKKGH